MKFYIDYENCLYDGDIPKQKIYSCIDDEEINPDKLVGKTIVSAGYWNSISRDILIEVE